MKFLFMTPLFNLKLESIKNKGIKLGEFGRISNSRELVDARMKVPPLFYTAGTHSLDEFDNTYFYYEGELKDVTNKDEMDKFGGELTFFLLRQLEYFLFCLWKVKDHNIYIRDGFLHVYDNNEEGFTYKASLSTVYTNSVLSRDVTIFSDNEIKIALEKGFDFSLDEYIKGYNGYKFPEDTPFIKGTTDRIYRSMYFLYSARGSNVFPMKIVFYCTSLECLFSTTTTELTHRISERVAYFIGKNTKQRIEIFKTIKKAYKIRSSIIHGSYIRKDEEGIKNLSNILDEYIREIYLMNDELFSYKDQKLDEYFNRLIMGEGRN